MSTPAAVGILKGKILSYVYVHGDGDLSYTGNMLLDHYNSARKAEALVKLGNMSIIKKRLAPRKGEPRGFEYGQRAPGVTVAYHRDRKEPYNIFCGSVPSGNVEDAFLAVMGHDSDVRRQYIFADGKWYFYKAPPYFGMMPMDGPMPLAEAVLVCGLDY